MFKKLLLFSCLALSMVTARAAYVPIAVTGYNADVVANGAGPSATSAPQDVDGVNYSFMAPDFNPSGTIFPTKFLPSGGLVTSAVATTPGLTYQLASYSGNNCLRINGTGSGTLNFATPQAAGEVYVLATGGSGACTVGMTVTFTDATTQVFASQAVGDWYNGTNYAIMALGRVNRTTDAIDNDAANPRLYQIKLSLLATNYGKQIASISFANTGAVLNVMGISIATVCTGTPTGGTATASAALTCATESLTLSTNGSNDVGISNQWQSSIDGGVTWTDIVAGTTNPYTFTGQAVATKYRNKVICTPSASTPVYSTVVTVGTRPCYCTPTFTNGCSSWRLTNVTIGTINNSPTVCGTSNYTAMSTTVTAGVPFPVSITSANYCGTAVFIDLNNDGDFADADETLYTEPYTGNLSSTVTPNLTIPGYALPGAYRIRFMATWASSGGNGACGAYTGAGGGNYHDYTLNVLNNASCFPPNGVASSAITANGATFTWTTPPSTTPLGYQWRIVAGAGPVTGTAVASGSMGAATLTVSPTGLASSTNYTFYVRSGCGSTSADSSVWVPVNFTTICGGAPVGGTAAASVISTCPATAFNLSVTGNTSGPGITYQWQNSIDNGVTWVDIATATSSSYTVATQTVTTLYRLQVICGGTTTSSSASIAVTQKPANQCYCKPTYSLGGTGDNIVNVVLGTLSNNSSSYGNPSPYYVDYTTQQPSPLAIPTLTAGQSYPLAITFGTDGTQYNGVWIDFNQDGTFGTTEYFTSGGVAGGGGTSTVTLAIPPTASLGFTRMRIRGGDDSQPNSGQACNASSSSYGEGEDYLVKIISNLPCTAPTTQATALVLTPGITSTSGSFTASVPAADGYLILRTPGTATPTIAPVNATAYTAGATLGNATVVSTGSNATTFTDVTVAPATQYRYTIYGYNDLCVGGPTYNTTTPLSGTATTTAANVYTWNGSVSTDWQIAGNWTPTRTTPAATDILQFNNGLTNNVTNVPTQTIGRLTFTGTTTAILKAQTTAARTLTIASDNLVTTNELDIAAGSNITLNDTVTSLTFKFAGTGATGKIAGIFEINNRNSITNAIDFTNSTDTVTATGTLAAGGTVNTSVFTSTAATLAINGNYIHKYTTVGGGAIPAATWGTASGVQITGYTTATGGPSGGLGQVFNNFTYNSPGQTVNNQWSGTLPGTVNGTLAVISTGTAQWQWATTSTYTMVANNYVQSGGVVDLSTSTGAKTVIVSGVFNQSAGILKATGTGTVTLNYAGTVAPQNVSFLDSSVAGPIVYRVTNPYGINLIGTGLLATTPIFKINTGGGVQITTAIPNPINTSLTLNYFATGTTLTYDGTAAQAITSAIWPVINGPLNLTINNTGTTLGNQVTLPGSRTLASAGILTMTNGVLALGSNNLTITNTVTGAISIATPGATRMIAADGSGQLIRGIATASTSYLFPVGDQTGTVEYSPVSLTTVSTGVRLMGVRVVNAHNPNDASATYLNRYWVFTDTATSAYTYNGNFTYTTADVVGTEASLRLSEWNGTAWTQIPSLPNTGVLTIQGTQSSAFLPLGGMQVTGRLAVANNIYTWNGSTSTDYQIATNWTPVRNVPDPADILQFNNGIIDTVKNIPTQTITRLTFTNNTTGIFQTPATNTLTINSDNVTTTDELSIAAGSNLTSNGTSALTLAFGGTGATVTIAGTMESVSTTVNNIFNFTNAVVTVAATGNLAEGGSNAGAAITGTTATNLLVNGLVTYKYTTTNPAAPLAAWNTGSTFVISGFTTQTGGPNGNQNQPFYNLTYNCPNQTAAGNWSGTGATTVINNLTVVSTGTGSWQFSNANGYTANIGNFIQTGGTFNTNSAAASAPCIFNISGTFNQTGGTFSCTAASTGANAPVINFNGTTIQNVTLFNAAPVGPFTYRVSNPAGINLTGSGTLTGAFNLNSNGGVRISTSAAAPINTTLALTYATGSTLTYDPTASATATAMVWPSTSGPINVTINTGGSSNVIAVPFSRTISGTLNMTSGDIDMSSNTLTLGTAAATPGTLTYTAGNIRVTTGAFNRYFGTTGLPTAAPTSGVGFYPIANSAGANRNVGLYFSTATSLSTGGSISVGHADATGIATITPVLDGAYSIDRRTNASWNFAQTGIVLSGANTIGVRVTGTGLITSPTPANLRVMQPAAVVGVHVPGSGVSAQRSGLVVADLASPYHIGANSVDVAGAFIAINTGGWSVPATWLGGFVPAVTNEAFINPGVTVTADAATNTAKTLTILPGGTLTVNSNTVTIDSAVLNNGTINVGGGTLLVNGNSGVSGIINTGGSTFNVSAGTATVGPTGGSNKQFTTNGTLNVTGGTLNINGNMVTNAGSTFNQSGGNINVDGNAASNAANSVASGVTIVSLSSQLLNLTGGTFTIVDPHPNATASRTFEYNTALGSVSAGLGHTFAFGNGTSTDTSANSTNGFRVNQGQGTSRLAFGNLVINGATGTNRFVSPGNGLVVLGNMTINSGGEYRTAASQLYLNGNLTVNTGGTLTSDAAVNFTNVNMLTSTSATINVVAATAAQTVSGTGTFRNSTSATPTANFAGLTVRNSANVTFSSSLVAFSGATTFAAGLTGPSRIIMPANGILYEISGASNSGPSQLNGWVVGRYQKAAASAGSFTGTLPVGDINYYTPIVFNTATVTTPGAIWGSTTALDHPNIGTSNITGAKSVNRYYTLTPVNGIAFSATSAATFNWNAADVDAGANTAAFAIGKYAASAWTYPTPASAAATSIQGTLIDLNVAGDYQVGEACSSPISITAQPANVSACLGGPVTLSVGLSATANVTYQWQKGTTNISGATGATYTIPVTAATDAGTYRVVLTSNCAAVTQVISANATLTINAPATITTQPATQAVCEGSPATVTVVATGTGLTYQWKKNGTNIAGANAATYTIPVMSYADTANYTVEVTGTAPCGYVTSAPATLTVKPLPLTISAAGSTNFCPGGSVVLNGPVTTPTNTLTYVWRLNTSIIPSQTNQSYTATASGSYTATITNTSNGCSSTSNAIVVNVNGAPQSTITPAGTAAFCQGGSIVLHGLSTPGLTYEWYLNGNTATVLGTDSVYTATVGGSYTAKVSIGSGCSTTSTPTVVTVNPLPTITTTPTGAQAICQNDTLLLTAFYTNASLVWKFNGTAITPAATASTYKAFNAGNYTVTATSTVTGCQNTSAPVTLTVNALPTVTVTSANAATFCAGGTDTLKASPATGLTFVWSSNGSPIAPAATGANYVATQTGSYTVTATNSNGCKKVSNAIAVTVNPLPNVIVTASLPLNMCAGQTNNLCVPTATGQTYQWSNVGGPITGATTACLAVTTAGTYTIKVTNTATGCNATSSASTVVVNAVPVATITPPAASTACVGDTVCLVANSGSNLTYQWKLGTNAIVGATNSIYCAITGGIYSVTVTNASGCSATSTPVTMTFNPRPTATISYTTPITFCEGGAVVLTGVSNTGNTYQWQNNGAALTGATTNNYIASSTGNYSVVITNGFGCSTVSPTILVVSNPLPQPVITRAGNSTILSTGSYASYQWYLNSQAINGATGQSHNATQNGGYVVRVVDANGCVNYSSVFFINNVGIGGNPAIQPASVKVFPNPVHNLVNIDAPAQVNVILRDLTGRMIKQVDNVKQLDMTGLPDGYYMLMISDKNGIMIKAEKVMKVAE